MPLIDLKTDLKSLKYGADRPGGGSSGQPFIVTDTDANTSVSVGANNILRFLGINNVPLLPNISSRLNRSRVGRFVNQVLSDDSFIRGGALGSAQSSINDLFRIGAFMTSLPKGTLFIAKQVGLQLSNPRMEVRKLPTGGGGGILGGLARFANNVIDKLGITPTRIYNLGVNTLAQVPANAFGVHFNRHGVSPIQDPNTLYINVVQKNNEEGNNRLVGYKNKLELGDKKTELSRQFNLRQARRENRELNRILRGQNRVVNEAQREGARTQGFDFNRIRFKKQKLDTTTLTIDSYIGGPGSVYGVGRTIINRYDFTEDGQKIDGAIGNSSIYGGRSRITTNDIDYTRALGINSTYQPRDKSISTYVTGSTPFIPAASFTKYAELKKKIDEQQQYSGSVFEYNSYKNTNLGSGGNDSYNGNINAYKNTPITYNNGIDKNPITIRLSGNRPGTWENANREVRVGSGRQDEINLTPIFSYSAGTITDNITIEGKPYNINDLVKFRIQALDSKDPNSANWMIFRAYLTQFSDSTDATWNDVKYVGRGEKFYVYDGFSRKIQIGFKAAALSEKEMKPMYQKLNYLMSNLMPDYADGLLMRGPLVRMTVGNWIDGQVGVLNSLTYTVPQDSPWEIAISEPTGDGLLILPHIVEVQMTFTPIGSQTREANKTPQKSHLISNIAQNINDTQYIEGNINAAVTGSVNAANPV
jgi:hypothetical protein